MEFNLLGTTISIGHTKTKEKEWKEGYYPGIGDTISFNPNTDVNNLSIVYTVVNVLSQTFSKIPITRRLRMLPEISHLHK